MTAKGRKEKLKGGDEHDVASRKARRIVPLSRGVRRKAKRSMNKRARRTDA